MFWIMHPDNYPFNDDGFGVEVKPEEMGPVEVIPRLPVVPGPMT